MLRIAAVAAIAAVLARTPATQATTLRDAGRRVGLLMGSQFKWDLALQESTRLAPYCALHASEYAMSLAGNVCKMQPTQPTEGTYTLDACSASVAHAHAAGQLYRGHVLCWYRQAPSFLDAYIGDKAALTTVLEDHIETVLQGVGSMYAWDVVNEAVSWVDGAWTQRRESAFEQTWGDADDKYEYMDVAFAAARAADPDALLFYNDFDQERYAGKAAEIVSMAEGLLERGVPIDGIGFQLHVDLAAMPDMTDLAERVRAVTDLGLEVQFTEVDILCTPPCDEEAQAVAYADLLNVCLDNEKCTAFQTWGFTDNQTWIGAENKPLPFDGSYRPKPAHDAMIDALNARAAATEMRCGDHCPALTTDLTTDPFRSDDSSDNDMAYYYALCDADRADFEKYTFGRDDDNDDDDDTGDYDGDDEFDFKLGVKGTLLLTGVTADEYEDDESGAEAVLISAMASVTHDAKKDNIEITAHYETEMDMGRRRRLVDHVSGLMFEFEIIVTGTYYDGYDDFDAPEAGGIQYQLEHGASDGSLESALQSKATDAGVTALTGASVAHVTTEDMGFDADARCNDDDCGGGDDDSERDDDDDDGGGGGATDDDVMNEKKEAPWIGIIAMLGVVGIVLAGCCEYLRKSSDRKKDAAIVESFKQQRKDRPPPPPRGASQMSAVQSEAVAVGGSAETSELELGAVNPMTGAADAAPAKKPPLSSHPSRRAPPAAVSK